MTVDLGLAGPNMSPDNPVRRTVKPDAPFFEEIGIGPAPAQITRASLFPV
jgi:hypothetical protein